jgi:hypothetical protein
VLPAQWRSPSTGVPTSDFRLPTSAIWRIAICVLAFVMLSPLAAADGYQPAPDTVRFYAWTTEQEVAWESAGDQLRFASRLTWKLGLRAAEVAVDRTVLKATIIAVSASHRGPGVEAEVDSATGKGGDDPLLGHLLALPGITLTLTVDPATGAVAAVEGGEAIIAAINRRAPAAVPGDPPPFDAQAQAAYGPEALARLWSQILSLPSAAAQRVALPPPFSRGELERSWTGTRWTARLPAGDPPAFELSREPAAIRGTLTALGGQGGLRLAGGLPAEAEGELKLGLAFDAMTQPVTTSTTLRWTLKTIAP